MNYIVESTEIVAVVSSCKGGATPLLFKVVVRAC